MTYPVPVPRLYTKSRSFTAPTDGIAVFSAAHFHSGGISQRLIGRTETWCNERGQYNQMGHLMAIAPCPLHHEVKKGATCRVETDYRNDAPIDGAMGVQFTYVWWGEQ